MPSLSDYAGTYLCLTNYYNISSGVSPLEYVLLNNGTISVTPKYQAKYPYIRVSGTFQRDGTLIITNNQTDGDIFTSRGIINRRLQKISGTFTSTSAGTGNFVCNKL